MTQILYLLNHSSLLPVYMEPGKPGYLGWTALLRSHLHKKFHSITYNVLSCVYMRAGPARLGEISPLLTRDLG